MADKKPTPAAAPVKKVEKATKPVAVDPVPTTQVPPVNTEGFNVE